MAYKEELHPLLEKAVEHIENIIIGKRDIAILSLAAARLSMAISRFPMMMFSICSTAFSSSGCSSSL